MAAGQTDFYNFSAANVVATTTNETVVGNTRAISTAYAGQSIFVQCGFAIQTGAAATAIILRIRQGNGITGTAIYSQNSMSVAATTVYVVTFAGTDQLTFDVASWVYSITVQQISATGNANIANIWSAVTVG